MTLSPISKYSRGFFTPVDYDPTAYIQKQERQLVNFTANGKSYSLSVKKEGQDFAFIFRNALKNDVVAKTSPRGFFSELEKKQTLLGNIFFKDEASIDILHHLKMDYQRSVSPPALGNNMSSEPSLEGLSLYEAVLATFDFVTSSSELREVLLGDSLEEIYTTIDEICATRMSLPRPVLEYDIQGMYTLLNQYDLTGEGVDLARFPAIQFILDYFACVEEVTRNLKAKEATGLGMSGSYFMSNEEGRKFVFKPSEEELGTVRNRPEDAPCAGIKPGTGAQREHVAFLLSKELKVPTPRTGLVRFMGQVGSLQRFKSGCASTLPIHHADNIKRLQNMTVEDVQATLLADGVWNNTDRHLGNFLVDGESRAYAIDNGGILTSSTEDPLKMELLLTPQARAPITDELKELYLGAPTDEWATLMRQHGIEDKSIELMEKKVEFFHMALSIAEEQKVKLSASDLAYFSLYENAFISEATEEQVYSLCHFIVKMKKEYIEKSKLSPGKQKAFTMLLHQNKYTNPRCVGLEYPGANPDGASLSGILFTQNTIY